VYTLLQAFFHISGIFRSDPQRAYRFSELCTNAVASPFCVTGAQWRILLKRVCKLNDLRRLHLTFSIHCDYRPICKDGGHFVVNVSGFQMAFRYLKMRLYR